MSNDTIIDSLLVIWLLLNLFDALLTAIGISVLGGRELNPFLAQFPLQTLVMIKMSLAILVGLLSFFRRHTKILLWGSSLVFGACIWNILQINGVI